MKKVAWKKWLAALLVAALLPLGALAALVVERVTADPYRVSVTTEADSLTIGNGYISRTFSTAEDKLTTVNITNKRTDGAPTVFTPGEGSEEFKLRVVNVIPALDRTGWTATTDSFHNATGSGDGNAPNLIDGNTGSIWHTKYGAVAGNEDCREAFPYSVVFNLGKSTTFQCFSWTQRAAGGTNGRTKGYELYYSTSATPLDMNADTGWTLLKSGQFNENDTTYVGLDAPCVATQLKLKATSSWAGNAYAGGAEFNLHAEKDPTAGLTGSREFSAGDLTLAGAPVVENTNATINGVAKAGQKVTFRFAPFTFRNVEYTIAENIVMYDGDHFMRKYLEISVPEAQKAAAVIDYIDLESLVANSTDATWTIPTDAGGIVQMEQFKANLGQPIYIQGMFFGCEFPVADNEIVDNVGYLRYYTGKSFDRFQKDNQLTVDGKYVTWQTVAGAARSTENEVIQADFFEYIKSIATPSDFRIQYNSWFDNMMFIDDNNILESFIEIDKELNNVGVRPLDSYVVDDGWNNYNNDDPVAAGDSTRVRRSGTTLNTDGFWTFNEKFPNELYPSSELVHNFGSNFGVWVGPRGGYNYEGRIASIIAAAGKGSQAGSIDVADRVYLKNFREMALDWMERFGVNYWKWDGFADGGQYGTWAATDGVPGYANHHMTGGYHNMYHVTDLWEGWIDLMEAVRQAEKDYNINKLWISLTCYVNPSPWYLQWANSVWIQCIHDQSDAGSSASKMDRQLTYREAAYYDFIKNHEFQFPLSNIYNHDPVYGKQDTGMNINTATDEQFQNYLYMQSTRGTAFWELYYSDSIMTPGKYEVTAEFLAWAEENYHMLRNSKMFGGSPYSTVKLNSVTGGGEQSAYGFACFDGTDGLISFRNSANETKSVTITFDRTIGVPENAGTLKYHMEHSHNLTAGTATTGEWTYGQQYTITLQPDEVRILRFSKSGDTTAPQFSWASSDGGDGVTVKFNEKVTGGTFTVNSVAATAEASADDCTFHLTVPAGTMTDGATVTVAASGVSDLAGNPLTETTVSFPYHAENTVAAQERSAQVDGVIELAAAANSLTGSNGFTVNAEVSTLSTGAVVSQGSQYALGIREDGKAYFTVGDQTAVSKTAVNDGKLHMITGVKENNGMMKIYVDGTLEGSAYLGSEKHTVALADINVGSSGFYGEVKAEVLDAALGYDQVAAKLQTETPDDPGTPAGETNLALNKSIVAKWTADGSNAAKGGDRPMSMAVDGNKSDTLGNYGEFGSDSSNASSYLQVDLEAVKSISGINLYRYWSDNRTYRGTVIELSETADFSGVVYQVYNSDATGALHNRGLGSDSTYAETSSGLHLTLTAPVNARYVRVYMCGTSSGNTNHVVELEVLGR